MRQQAKRESTRSSVEPLLARHPSCLACINAMEEASATFDAWAFAKPLGAFPTSWPC